MLTNVHGALPYKDEIVKKIRVRNGKATHLSLKCSLAGELRIDVQVFEFQTINQLLQNRQIGSNCVFVKQ